MQKRIESPQLDNALKGPTALHDSTPSLSPATESTPSFTVAAIADRKLRLAIGTGAAMAILTSLALAPFAAAPQFHPEPQLNSPVSLSRNLPAEVAVRIWSLSAPPTLRAIPVDATSRFRFCNSCNWVHQSGETEVRAVDDQTEFGAANAPQSSIEGVELSGAWRLELPSGIFASSADRATISASKSRLQVTLRMTMEEYVAGVLAAEARGFASSESLKAMAVAIRTYATRFRGRHRLDSFDFCDSTHCQALRLVEASGRFLAAARATAGEILMYDGKPATTYYHRDCGGTTEGAGIAWRDVNAPYLTQQQDPYCTHLAHDGWSTEISQSDLTHALTTSGITPPPGWRAIEVVTRTPSGRARKLRLVGASNLLIAAPALRLAVARAFGGDKVRSDLFDVRVEGSRYIFSGVGSGHGVGLCQAGAAEMGTEGKSYDEILSFYYPGTTLHAPPQRPTVVSGN